MNTPGLRLAQLDDVAQIVAIDRATNPLAWTTAMFAEELDRPDASFLVADIGSGVAGFAVARFVLDEAELLLIAVDPGMQRSGLGRRLLRRLIDECVARRCTTLRLEVRASNAAAIALYEATGFLLTGRRPRYYRNNGEDALLFDLPLGVAAIV